MTRRAAAGTWAADQRPAIVVVADSARDVAEAMRFARAHGCASRRKYRPRGNGAGATRGRDVVEDLPREFPRSEGVSRGPETET
jgi:FAD/FMN-containing dehydrogenase